MPLLNYTTRANAQKTVTEVMGLLVAKGANEISIVYDDNQQPAGLKWTVQSPGHGWLCHALQHRRSIMKGPGAPMPSAAPPFLHPRSSLLKPSL